MTHIKLCGKNKFIVLFLIVNYCVLKSQIRTALSKSQKDSLSNVLNIVSNLDQKYRWTLMLGEFEGAKLDSLKKLEPTALSERILKAMKNEIGINKSQKDSIRKLQDNIDSTLYFQIIDIFSKFGYLGRNVDEHSTMGLILRHNLTRLDTILVQKLKVEVKNENMEALEFASLLDYKYVGEGKRALYCVSKVFEPKSKTFVYPKPMDLKATNAARKEIGLKPIKRRKLKYYTA